MSQRKERQRKAPARYIDPEFGVILSSGSEAEEEDLAKRQSLPKKKHTTRKKDHNLTETAKAILRELYENNWSSGQKISVPNEVLQIIFDKDGGLVTKKQCLGFLQALRREQEVGSAKIGKVKRQIAL